MEGKPFLGEKVKEKRSMYLVTEIVLMRFSTLRDLFAVKSIVYQELHASFRYNQKTAWPDLVKSVMNFIRSLHEKLTTAQKHL